MKVEHDENGEYYYNKFIKVPCRGKFKVYGMLYGPGQAAAGTIFVEQKL